MHFFRDNSVSFVLESSCIFIYTAVLGFGILRRSTSCIHAVVRTIIDILVLMYRDVLYAGFAGAKTGHRKITIFRNILTFLRNRL
jgi:hypothetical protein